MARLQSVDRRRAGRQECPPATGARGVFKLGLAAAVTGAVGAITALVLG